MKKSVYLTTSIAYVNAPPHIGFALEVIQADVIARYNKSLGKKTYLLTGTDEHGAKIAKAAKAVNKTPVEFTDEISGKFKELALALNISNDDFIRTSDQKRHWPVVKKVWQQLEKYGDLYKKDYQGLYCEGCEAFITQKDLVDGKCKIHLKEPQVINEENYFFRLSKYSEKIKAAISKDKIKIIPASRKNEIMSFLKKGLEDISFSRPRKDLQWGIPVPNDDTQTIYVWADALVNYISAIGYSKKSFEDYWPASVHFVGKDILKFHALIWPAMLLSLKLPLPKTIFVHGFINVGGHKMSKSLGNVINPFELIEKYGADTLRYFLLREIPPVEDGDFTYEKFEERYNADLAKGIGNLVARVVSLAAKLKREKEKEKTKIKNPKLEKEIKKTKKQWEKSLKDFKFNESLATIFELISFCNKYIDQEKPWEDLSAKKQVIFDLLFAIEEIASLLLPFLPDTSEKIQKQLKSKESVALFPRLY